MEFSAVNRRRPSRETPLGPRAKKDGCFRGLTQLVLFSKKYSVPLSNAFSSSNLLFIRLFLANTWKNSSYSFKWKGEFFSLLRNHLKHQLRLAVHGWLSFRQLIRCSIPSVAMVNGQCLNESKLTCLRLNMNYTIHSLLSQYPSIKEGGGEVHLLKGTCLFKFWPLGGALIRRRHMLESRW